MRQNIIQWVVKMVLEKCWSLDACYGYAKAHSLYEDSEMVCVKTLYNACYGYAKAHSLYEDSEMVCVKTLYNYVDSMLLAVRNIDLPLKVRRRKRRRNVKENLKHLGRSIDERPDEIAGRNESMLLAVRNIDLPLKVRRRKRRRNVKENLKHLGRSIDERPDEIAGRNEFGHWEIDTVIGSKSKSDKVVLTIVERLTRKYIAIKIDGKTASAVSAAMQSLQKYYGDKFSQIFKTITSDNGSEFAELSKLENDTTTKVYFVP